MADEEVKITGAEAKAWAAATGGEARAAERPQAAREAEMKARLLDLVEGRLSLEEEAKALEAAEREPWALDLLAKMERAAGRIARSESPIAGRERALVDEALGFAEPVRRTVREAAREAAPATAARAEARREAPAEPKPARAAPNGPSLGERVGEWFASFMDGFRQPAFAGAFAALAVAALAVGVYFAGFRQAAEPTLLASAGLEFHRVRTRSIEQVPQEALTAGDGFKVTFELERPALAAVWLVDPLGAVSRLYPDDAEAAPLTAGMHTAPTEKGQWFILDEQRGTETVLVLAGAAPVDADAFRAALAELWNAGEGFDESKVPALAARFGQKIEVLHVDHE